MNDFYLGIHHEADLTTLVCSGEVDAATAGKLRDALDLALDGASGSVVIDGRTITLLTSSGIEALLHGLTRAQARGISVSFRLSDPARKVLDLVGLWWLGVVDDGFAVKQAFEDAMRRGDRGRDAAKGA